MNELEAKFKSKGLSIIGVTSAGASETEKWIADKGAKFAYGYDKTGKLAGAFGISGIPHAILFDPTGKSVWRGHPGNLSEGTIEKSLAGALPKLPWEWEPALQPAAQLVVKRQYAKAITEAGKAGAAGEPLANAVRAIVTGRVAGLQEAKQAGDFLLASEDGASLAKELAGLPEQAEVAALVKELAADKEAQKVIAGQKQVRELSAEKPKKRDLPNVLKKLEKIKTDQAGTAAARDAEAAITKLRRAD